MVRYYQIKVDETKQRLSQGIPFRVDSLGRLTSLCTVEFERLEQYSEDFRKHCVDLGTDRAVLGFQGDLLDKLGLRVVEIATKRGSDKAYLKSHYPNISLKRISKSDLKIIMESRDLALKTKIYAPSFML